MKISISTRQLFMLGLALLIVTNLVVFAGVFYNRSGEPEQQITLTERELKPPYYTFSENSGISLRIIWRVLNDTDSDRYQYTPRPIMFSDYWGDVAWLDRDKLEQLGFDTEKIIKYGDDYQRRKVTIPREAYIVLEYDGATYQQALKNVKANIIKANKALASKPDDEELQEQAKNTEQWLAFERVEHSRLFAIDAGLDLDALRQKYSDRNHYIFAQGLISAQYNISSKEQDVSGHIQRLHIDTIHVPLQFRQLFDNMSFPHSSRRDAPPKPPRFAVNLNYGKRIEPWIESVQKLETPEQEAQPPASPE